MKIQLKKVRLSFPALFVAKSFEDNDPKFEATFLIDKNSPVLKEMLTTIEAVAKEKWGAKADSIMKTLHAAGKVCLRDGADKEYDGYANCMYVKASSKKRPLVVDLDGKTPLAEADGRPYGGCTVNGYIDIWAMDNQYGKRICASLSSVQFAADGEPFGATATADVFESEEDLT